jgi:hypothetical protein
VRFWRAGITIILIGLGAAGVAFTTGASTMPVTGQAEPLVWQGAADRSPSDYLSVRVTGIHHAGGGVFGIGNSPSIVGALPDARVIEGTRIGGDGSVVKARVPGGELPRALAAGSRLVLGLVDPSHVICLLLPPDAIADEALSSWARTQRCG